ncbi:MAG: bacteriocin family protein [Chloroflexi bacterium]|nr:bacteriocin family protein [Chloroflexota bacterium]
MTDYLMRDGAPFGPEIWETIDKEVVEVVKHTLVGRRFIALVGPLGWGVDLAPKFVPDRKEPFALQDRPEYIPLVELSQSFLLRARHLAMAEQTKFGLDLGAIAQASIALAKAEDELLIGGLLKAAKQTAPLGDWDNLGGPFKAVSAAIGQLRGAGFEAPYALVMNPVQYAKLAGLMSMGRREIDMVEKIAGGGIQQWAEMPVDQVLVVAAAPWNVDMVVGQDVVTGFTGNVGLDYEFKVFETLALRVKRPGALFLLK